MAKKIELSAQQINEILETLHARFKNNMHRHPGIDWSQVQERLENNKIKLWSLSQMDNSGGEPDVIDYNKATAEFMFADCALESPKGRRSICYDQDALMARKENKPKDSAQGMAEAMRIDLLTEAQFRHLQTLGEFDLKTSSWVQTPPEIRKLGGALFCDRRYNHVFVYHNGADSYYAARGFRGCLLV